jgi:hypothetical protein
VLSMGSESHRLSDKQIEYARKFATVIAWFDKSEIAKKQAEAIGAYAVSSPDGQDANDLLRAGHLGGFLSAVRLKACRNDQQRERLLWNLWDAAQLPGGVDDGTAWAIAELSHLLGK